MAGFSLSGVRTLHRTAFDYSAKGLTLRASAEALFNAAPAPVVRVRSPYSEEPAYGGFFAFWGTDSPSNCVRLFGLKTSPCGPALKRCSTRRQRRLSESGRPIQKNPPMAGFLLFRNRTLHRTAFDYSAKGLTLRASAKALFNTAPAPVVRVRSPYLEEPAYGGFFAFWGTDSPSNCVRLFGQRPHPAGQR
ncbi:Uncharacterised protein [Serratia marcescens]|nr:Uncharacterised protein [Serratia marcescens]